MGKVKTVKLLPNAQQELIIITHFWLYYLDVYQWEKIPPVYRQVKFSLLEITIHIKSPFFEN